MILKVFKAVWFLSLVIFLGVFLYDYASLPETVTVVESDEVPLSLSKDGVFYGMLFIVVILNLFVFIINQLYAAQSEFRTWFYGLIIILNIFLLIGINFVSLYNSAEKFNFAAIGSIIYGSILLILFWLIGWPTYLLLKKIFFKRTV